MKNYQSDNNLKNLYSVDNNEHIGNSYYYEYEIISNGEVKKGKFRIYDFDKDINITLKVETEIKANKSTVITIVDANLIICDVREKKQDNVEYQKFLNQQNKTNRKSFKRELIIGISIFALIAR